MKTVVYFYRGQIERYNNGKRSYRWCDGYSENTSSGVGFPWMTKAECRRIGRQNNHKVVFDERRK